MEHNRTKQFGDSNADFESANAADFKSQQHCLL